MATYTGALVETDRFSLLDPSLVSLLNATSLQDDINQKAADHTNSPAGRPAAMPGGFVYEPIKPIFAVNGANAAYCLGCIEKNQAVARCRECNENLCEDCVCAHKRVRCTKDHHIELLKFGNLVESTPRRAGVNGARRCSIHGIETGSFFCNVCHRSICAICKESCCAVHSILNTNDVDASRVPPTTAALPQNQQQMPGVKLENGHSMALGYNSPSALNHFAEAAAAAHVNSVNRLAAVDISNEVSQYDRSIECALENVTKMAEKVELRVQAVASEVCAVTQLHANVLEERKRKLLQKLDRVRSVKLDVLRKQKEELTNASVFVKDLLGQAIGVNSCSSAAEAEFLRKMYLQKIAQLRGALPVLTPLEDDVISFASPNPALVDALRRIGSVETGAFAANCAISGEGFQVAVKNKTATFIVQTRDHCGEACLGGNEQLTVCISTPLGNCFLADVVDRKNGQYMCSYKPTVEGNHVVQVMLRGKAIGGTPFSVRVRSGRDYTQTPLQVVTSFGCEGDLDGQLQRPWGICSDKLGRLIVADRSNNRIQVFTSQGQFLFKFGNGGNQSGQFDRPAGVAVNSRNDIIVADKDNHRVQVFNAEGKFLSKFGDKGRSVGQFNYPWDVAVNSQDQIAVTDTRNHRVQLFSPSGVFLRKFALENALYKNFDSPRGVAFTHTGNLVVTDFNNHRLVLINYEDGRMQFYGQEGELDGTFKRPQGVEVDCSGNVIVCDSRNNRLTVFGPDFSFIGNICRSQADGTSLMDRPCDVCCMSDGRFAVVDFGNNKIRIF